MNRAGDPERTCLACRERGPKGTMLRIVMGPEGLRIDQKGPGRGAYLHRSEGCLRGVDLRRALPKALRTGVPSDGAARLGTELHRLLEAH